MGNQQKFYENDAIFHLRHRSFLVRLANHYRVYRSLRMSRIQSLCAAWRLARI